MATLRKGDTAYVTKGPAPGRRSPGGPYKTGKNGKRLVRKKGFKFVIHQLKKSKDGTVWARTNKGTWYSTKRLGLWHVGSPVPGYGVNYPFGVKNSGYAAGFHTGEDHAAPVGANIVAVTAGRIRVAHDRDDNAYGRYTILKSDNGHEYLYAHQSDIRVKTGQKVKANQVIGKVGYSGNVRPKGKRGAHTHFEQSKGGTWSYGHVKRPTW